MTPQRAVQHQTPLYWCLVAHGSKLMKKANISVYFLPLYIHEVNFPSCPLFFFYYCAKLFLTVSHNVYIQLSSVLSFPLWFSQFFSCFLLLLLKKAILFPIYSCDLSQLYIETHQFCCYLFSAVSSRVTADKPHQLFLWCDQKHHHKEPSAEVFNLESLTFTYFGNPNLRPKGFKSIVYFLLMAFDVCRMIKCMTCVLKVCMVYFNYISI